MPSLFIIFPGIWGEKHNICKTHKKTFRTRDTPSVTFASSEQIENYLECSLDTVDRNPKVRIGSQGKPPSKGELCEALGQQQEAIEALLLAD